jgi:hypothetical protein
MRWKRMPHSMPHDRQLEAVGTLEAAGTEEAENAGPPGIPAVCCEVRGLRPRTVARLYGILFVLL